MLTNDPIAPLDTPPIIAPSPAPRPDVAQRAGRGVFWNAVFLPLKLVLALAASVVVVRLLRIGGYPLYLSVTALLNTLGVLSDLGVERALPRFIPEVEIREGRAGLGRFLTRVTIIKVLTLVPFVALLALAPAVFLDQLHLQGAGTDPALGLPTESGPFLLLLLGAMLVLGALSDVSIQVLYAYFKQKITNTLDVINAVVMPGLRVGFVVGAGTLVGVAALGATSLEGARVVAALLALLVGTGLAVILSLGMMFRALREAQAVPLRAATPERLAHLPPPATFWRRFGAYSAMMYILNFSVYLYSQPFVVIMVPLILPIPTEQKLVIAGLGVAYNLVQRVLQAVFAPMNGVQTPLFSRLYAENRMDALRTTYALMSKVLILALVPTGVGVIVLARNVLILLFMQVGADAVVTVDSLNAITLAAVVLVLGLFGESVISVALLVLLVFEKYRAVLIARLTALISLPLLFLLVPSWGMVGAAAALAGAGFGSRLVALVFGERELGLRFPIGFLGRVALAAGAMGVVVWPLSLLLPAQPLRLGSPDWFVAAFANGVLMAGGMTIFYGLFRVLGGLDAEDKARFASLRLPLIGRVLRWL